ncbi:50S ribosomal protein L35 [bacterium]|jgi:large subunit ribosomal protein L35|nr:50S ribosomal protein L35 [bacterium]NBX98181.1 50S ribosomal protein L35 [bacterium]NDC95028.1 50S ribosomal protein L35 [bacterium]NDD84735.1 50S ribosomal protein L35 [bacterium]NDG28967.1 50S ribosomal protein L35 [bacterium]
MPKLKTHSGTKDRVKISKNGKVMMRRASGNHLLEHKSARRKRSFAGLQTLTGKSAKNLKLKLGSK